MNFPFLDVARGLNLLSSLPMQMEQVFVKRNTVLKPETVYIILSYDENTLLLDSSLWPNSYISFP